MNDLTRKSLIIKELRTHLPFTLVGSAAAMLALFLVYTFLIPAANLEPHDTFEDFFHLFHYGHVLVSAIATTAIFLRNEGKWLPAVLIGYFSTLIACGISDLLLPHIGGLVLGARMHLHICLIEAPVPVLLANTAGIVLGFLLGTRLKKTSFISHSLHIFLSSFASLFYLVSFGIENWVASIIGIFIVTVFAVTIPCCSSDIIIPLSFVSGLHGHEHEDEHTHSH